MKTDAKLPGLVETVLFDAGGVLLELDFAYVKRLIEVRGIAASLEDLSRAEVVARAEIHRYVSEGGRVGDAWRDYFHTILGRVGLHADEQPDMIDSLWEAHQRFGLWTVATEGGPEAVAELKRRGYRIGDVRAETAIFVGDVPAVDVDGARSAGVAAVLIDRFDLYSKWDVLRLNSVVELPDRLQQEGQR